MQRALLLIVFLSLFSCKQEVNRETASASTNGTSTYSISFENAVHHEAVINATFTGLPVGEAEFRMSRTSPGRYALHEFMKNIYDVKVTDGVGNELKTTRPDPYSWLVNGHDGTIKVSYTLYANRGDGTYAQVDETHAHLNIPATFIYAPSLENNDIEVTFNVREDLGWKVATQLKHVEGNTYYARDLQYFMDSPTEVSNHSVRSFDVGDQKVNFALHHNGTDAEFDEFFERVKKVVLQQEAVFGELPKYDYGEYTFLGCYIPNASGDGMEHRNSTIVTSTRSLANGGLSGNLGTVSHEFFHCWNVERIRPQSLDPFDFKEANMSGELWFAEGFTSYYTNLMITRAGLMEPERYVRGLTGTFNYVWNSPGRKFFNPIEMSYQAPFVDAARSVDDINRNNTFISYYSYGSALGLALDLSLREQGLNLDDYMKLVWTTYGKVEDYYTIQDLHNTLNEYAGADFGDAFFNNYIYKSEMPDYERLFKNVGVYLANNKERVSFGGFLRNQTITANVTIGSSAYEAGLEKGDKLIKIGDIVLTETTRLNDVISQYKPNDMVTVTYERLGKARTTQLTFQQDPSYSISLFEVNNIELPDEAKANRDAWLKAK
ncbi:PDZ domain-containing protein [Flavobacteriaceae bacterium AU392]|nr:M61 family peptidase [Flavobacteriaceae bacterium]RKM84666.1 PDZ domain-containing protein [Flavobacteriaceae bacterium AU392]